MIDKFNHGRGGEISIKFVGTVSDMDEIKDMENICKVFLIEQWLENIQYPITNLNNIETCLESSKKINMDITHICRHLPILTVKGLK
jgi:hypothetical protein